jgi:hypothetical protein
MEFILLLIFFILIIVLSYRSGAGPGRTADLADEVMAAASGFDQERVQKYLEIKSDMKGATEREMIRKIAAKKKIRTAAEFNERLRMGPYTFMTAPEQIDFEESLQLL